MNIKSFKLATLALLTSFYIGNAVAEEVKSTGPQVVAKVDEQPLPQQEVNLTTQQLELENKAEEERLAAEKKAEQERLAAEKQQQAEQSLFDRIGDTQLQFKPLIAKIYTENNFSLIWTDAQAKQQFLHDYALMVAAGVSKRSSGALNAVSDSVGKGELIEDIILTDAFLDYLYYANNVQRSAQKWLYSENSYKAGKFDENQLSAWLSAVKNNDNLAFVKNLSSDNP